MNQAQAKSLRDKLFQKFSDFVSVSVSVSDSPAVTYNPATSTATTVFAVSETVTGFVRSYTRFDKELEILPGDVEIIISSENLSGLSPDAQITINSKTYRVVKVLPVPEINTVIFRVHGRGLGNE